MHEERVPQVLQQRSEGLPHLGHSGPRRVPTWRIRHHRNHQAVSATRTTRRPRGGPAMNGQHITDGQTLTFWSLLGKYGIEIPTIQRDYVQGRNDEQAREALNGLLDDIHKHLSDDDSTPLSLNFVYGEITRPATGDAPGVCQPLDGQQRLTTLYLIHWFALAQALAENPDMDISASLARLTRFTYQTRATSRDFFEKISSNNTTGNSPANTETETDASGATGALPTPAPIRQMAEWLNQHESAEDHSTEPPSAFLRDKNWFRPDFAHDPTIIAVLNVLDNLADRRFDTIPNLWGKLIGDSCPIRFEWLDVKNIGNGDDLYIKMNARGRQLSDFENLKAEIEQEAKPLFVHGSEDPEYLELCRKFDQEWSDFFWTMHGTVPPDERDDYDGRFMRFMNWSLWNQWAIRIDDDKLNRDYSLKGVDQADTRHRRLNTYRIDVPDGTGILDKAYLDRLTRYLDYVSSDNALQDFVDITRNVCVSGATVDYPMRMRLESAMAYIDGMTRLGKSPDSASWKAWRRIIDNLSDAAQLWQGYNTVGMYAQAVRAVEQFVDHADDLTGFLATFPGITGFNPRDQYEDEQLKAYLITHNDRWAESIHAAESTAYFGGKIGFLLAFVGVDRDSCAAMTEGDVADDAIARLNRYLNIAKILFPDTDHGASPDTDLLLLFRRALLTKGDFSLRLGTIRSYIIETDSKYDRSIGWRNLLRDGSTRNPADSKRDLVRALYDDVLDRIDAGSGVLDRTSLEVALNNTIEEYLRQHQFASADSGIPERPDWQADAFIAQPILWSHDYMGALWQYRVEDGICYLPANNNIQLNGRNNELDSCLIVDALRTVCEFQLHKPNGRLYPYIGQKTEEPSYATISLRGNSVDIGKRYVALPGQSQMTPRIIVTHGDTTTEYDTVHEAIHGISEYLGIA
ncbi:hypothetical protein COO72_10360 [Bifidobacterium callitrichos]|nr:hypothetical protein COO72_10360 [Bifidobacterium callitrichos]